MPIKKPQYNLVQQDEYDTRIPMHSEEAFEHGITFQAKYIGTLDVPRPTSRVEIVAAMRRIRYEFKAKGIKKKKVTLEVSVEGVKVTLRKKKKKKEWLDENNLIIMQHPIYRIFYVSHDSQDLKIFSYIARDGSTNIFKCNVFKSSKKSQAMRVVRTVGQAFEVCHKLSINSPSQEEMGRKGEGDKDHSSRQQLDLTSQQDGGNSDRDELPTDQSIKKDLHLDRDRGDPAPDAPFQDSSSTLDLHSTRSDSVRPPSPLKRPLRLDIIPPPPLSQTLAGHTTKKSPMNSAEVYSSPPSSEPLKPLGEGGGGGLLSHHELQLMREQLEQQAQQTQAALSQVHLLREQLQVETNARIEAQTRIHQLLTQNKDLLDHIQSLVAHLQDQERLHKLQVAQVTAVAAQHQHHQQQQQHQQQQHHNVNSTVPQASQMSPTSKVTNWFAATSAPFGVSIGSLKASSGALQASSGALNASRGALQASSGVLQGSRGGVQGSSRSVGLRASSTLPRQESGFVDDNVEEATRDLLLARIPTKKRKRIVKMHKGNVKTF